MTTENFPFQ